MGIFFENFRGWVGGWDRHIPALNLTCTPSLIVTRHVPDPPKYFEKKRYVNFVFSISSVYMGCKSSIMLCFNNHFSLYGKSSIMLTKMHKVLLYCYCASILLAEISAFFQFVALGKIIPFG